MRRGGAAVWVLAGLAAAAVLAPWVAPFAPDALDLVNRREMPSAAHWFGTDDLGRDLLSRILFGARVSLAVGVLSAVVAALIGVGIGAASGVAGGALDAASFTLIRLVTGALTLALLVRLRGTGNGAREPWSSAIWLAAYAVTFTLSGFNTFKREGLELPTDFTATIDVEMRLGTLEETVTVTGESPVVDVSSTAQVQVLDREMLDSIPTGRSIYSMAQLITGVTLNQPDTGGSRSMQQVYMSTRGLTSANNIVLADGLMINGLDGDTVELVSPAGWIQATELATLERDRAGKVTALVVSTGRIKKMRFERTG